MLDQKTIEIVKSTVPALKEHGVEITKTFIKICLLIIRRLSHYLIWTDKFQESNPKR